MVDMVDMVYTMLQDPEGRNQPRRRQQNVGTCPPLLPSRFRGLPGRCDSRIKAGRGVDTGETQASAYPEWK